MLRTKFSSSEEKLSGKFSGEASVLRPATKLK
jgi:hypothetical protein